MHREGDEDSNGRGQCRNVRIESPHVAQLQPSQCANVRKNVCHTRGNLDAIIDVVNVVNVVAEFRKKHTTSDIHE